MNVFTFSGYIGQDIKIIPTSTGKVFGTFSVANKVGFGQNKTTNWFNCKLWGERANKLQPYLKKGTSVIISGELVLREYEKDGVKMKTADVNINQVDFSVKTDESTEQTEIFENKKFQNDPQKNTPKFNENEKFDDVPF